MTADLAFTRASIGIVDVIWEYVELSKESARTRGEASTHSTRKRYWRCPRETGDLT
jgi:hypothetical protein